MSSTIEQSKLYNCKVTIRSRPSTISFIKERLSKSNKRLKLFKDTVFGKYLDLDVEDNDNHLLNYKVRVLLGDRFCLHKLVFPEYMDDDIPLFLRHVFLDKVENLENKASLGKVAQGKAAKGKAAKGKVAKGKDAKRKAAQGKAAQPSDIDDTHSVTILDLRSLIWDDEKWKKLSVEDSIRVYLLYMSKHIFTGHEDKKVVNNSFLRMDLNPVTQIRSDLKERDENWCRKMYDYVACKERSEQVDDQNGLTRNDEPEVEQDGSASVKIARKNLPGLSFLTPNAKATSVCDDIDEADAATDDNAKSTSVRDDVGVLDAAADDNAKATSVCDDIHEADASADDNVKATSVHDDVGVPDAAANDNAKATSVCDDINEDDAAVDDNEKGTSVYDDVDQADAAADDKVPIFDVYNTQVDNENVLIKDALKIINHTDPPIHGFQIMLWGSLEKKGDGLDEAKANQEVVSVADNGEVVKETQLPHSHEDVFQLCASKRMKKENLLSDCPPSIGII
nr:phospholipase-like protein [Tanacetum cinerariifolium]